nr:MAG TPA: hypothetical protein [Bacteriophage sp.]
MIWESYALLLLVNSLEEHSSPCLKWTKKGKKMNRRKL